MFTKNENGKWVPTGKDVMFPWEVPPLDGWYIVCLNHYVRDGNKRIFCAMSRNGVLIEARGDDTKSVFWRLVNQAEVWNKVWKTGRE